MGTWKAGIIMIEKRLNLVRGLPTVLDETRVVKHPDVVDQVLYQVPMDQGAARGGGWASGLPWNTVLISTGEQPALSFTSHEGAAARVLSLRRPPFGLGGERSAADALAVTEGVGEQHGTAGPAFIARLTAMLAEPDGPSRLRKRHQVLADAHAEAAGNDVARRRAPHVAALHLAAELACEWDIVPFEALEAEVWTELLADETVREDRGGMALEVVRGLIAAHAHRIQTLNAVAGDTRFVPPPGGWIGAYVDTDDRPAVALLPAAVAQALAAASPPIVLDAVREAWAETGTIVMDGRRLARESVNGRQVRAYVFPLSVLDEEDTARSSRQQEASPAHPQGLATQAASTGWPAGTIGADANP
jgi:hypothetical protein